ncbi:MAG: Haloacid dehalogenase, type II [uncultured Rubrobacteraceae bacterium]|uniref:Haloacid dehalogenase, type II n=1 Tax=uncultured Rubrobacteraceae bacterium TaxID=349277 RepID=A0A6J4R1K4_9ACTN|nr:MAG: Haloacid dehalogenase, type II [uncultured Rubrobacteraceae bacterium]
MDPGSLKALAFDVFGTVVDWRGSVIREGEALAREKSLGDVDWPAFADAWRGRYAPSMDRVRRGELPWRNLDALHRASLEELLVEFGIEGLTEADRDHLNRAWHRLAPWPDTVEGLTRLKEAYTITTLSNGNVALLNDMAKAAGLPWDLIFSAELVRRYKPDPETYLMVPGFLGLRPEEVMLVACHPSDLRAAREHGLRTAYVVRPLEWGPDWRPEPPDPSFDVNAEDFLELAEKLGA